MSTPVKTQADFQRVCTMRIEEAEALLAAGKWDGAYYLAGYSVELALKSCIIKKLLVTDEFPAKRFSEQCYQHDLILLLKLSGLEDAMSKSGKVAANWPKVKGWSEQSRYEFGRSEQIVREFIIAITDPIEGVLPWIQSRW